jgi:hypothetical protein
MPTNQEDKVYIPVFIQNLYYTRITSYVARGMWKSVTDFITEAVIDKLIEIESQEALNED